MTVCTTSFSEIVPCLLYMCIYSCSHGGCIFCFFSIISIHHYQSGSLDALLAVNPYPNLKLADYVVVVVVHDEVSVYAYSFHLISIYNDL